MEHATLQEKLIAVIRQVQTDSGLECPPLEGETKPVGNVPKFDSMVWPVATTLLAEELRKEIPNGVNIFVDATNKQPRSINETVEFLRQLFEKQEDKVAATA